MTRVKAANYGRVVHLSQVSVGQRCHAMGQGDGCSSSSILYLFGFPRRMPKNGEGFCFRPVDAMISKQRGGRVA